MRSADCVRATSLPGITKPTPDRSRLLRLPAVNGLDRSGGTAVAARLASGDGELSLVGLRPRLAQGDMAVRTRLSTFWSNPSLRIGISSGWKGFFMT